MQSIAEKPIDPGSKWRTSDDHGTVAGPNTHGAFFSNLGKISDDSSAAPCKRSTPSPKVLR